MEKIKSLLDFLFQYVIIAAILYIFYMAWASTKIASGYNYIYVSIAVFCVFAYLQYLSLSKLLEQGLVASFKTEKSDVFTSWYLRIIFFIGLTIFLLFVGVNVYAQLLSNEEALAFRKVNNAILIAPFNEHSTTMNIVSIVWGLFLAFMISLVLTGYLFSLGLLGPLGIGLGLSIALHNWFNGKNFDLSIIFEILFNFSIPILLSLVIKIFWFLPSFGLLKKKLINKSK